MEPIVEPFLECVDTALAGDVCSTGVAEVDTAVGALRVIVENALGAVGSCPAEDECALRPYTDCTAEVENSQCEAQVRDIWRLVAAALCDPDTVTEHVSPCTPDPEVIEATACGVVEAAGAACPTGIEPVPTLRACAAGDDPAGCVAAAAEESGRGVVCEEGLAVPCAAVESCPDGGDECPARPVTDCAAATAASQCVVADEWAAVAGAVCDPESVNEYVSQCDPDGEVAEASLFALVDGAFCGQDDEPPCAPQVVTDVDACTTWTDGSPALEGNCVVDAVVAAACAAVTEEDALCVLQDEPMASLLNCADLRTDATGACRDTRQQCADANVDRCAEGLRHLTLNALCAANAAGCFPQLGEDLDTCDAHPGGPDATEVGCSAAALLRQACRPQECPAPVVQLEPCLMAPAVCANPVFLQTWVGQACRVHALTASNTACPKANPYVSATGAIRKVGDVEVQVDFENGSSDYPFRSIGDALNQINQGWFQIPALVREGTYIESLAYGGTSPELRAVREGTGVVTLNGGANPGLTLSGTRRVSLAGIAVTSTSSARPIVGPVVTVTVAAPAGRRFVGAAVRYRVTDAVDSVAAPEPLRRQLVLSSPFHLDPDNLRISAVVDGVAVTPTITRVGDDIVVEFGQAGEAGADPWVTPVGWRGTAEITVIPRSAMRLRGAARVVGGETGVLYDEMVSANEVRVVRPTSGELPDGQPEVGVVIGPAPAPSAAPAPGPLPGPAGRLSGEDRAATAAAVSASSFGTGVERVYIASGSGYADALAAGPAAGRAKSPVLLVERDRLPDSTRAELERLAPQRVFVLGGDAVVGADVERRLRALAPRLDRISGGDRYGTAAAIASGHFDAGVPVTYVASGEGFADALAAGPAAAAQGGPVLLVRPDAIPEATATELRRLAPGRIVVLGGTKAVSDLVATQLRLFTTGEVRRLRGSDRYGTAAAVTAHAFTRRVDTIYVATGAGFADALAGAPAAAQDGSPLLLVEGDRLPAPAAVELDRLRPKRIVILGGERSVSLRLERELRSYETARA